MAKKRKRKDNPIFKVALDADVLHIFTDGSSNCKDKSGGWGALLVFNEHRKYMKGGKPGTTNNEMELAGIYHGLCAVKSFKYPIVVYSDSQYSVNAVTVWHQGWKRKGWLTGTGTPVKNLDMIKAILDKLDAMRKQGAKVNVRWLKGHAGHEWNEAADKLAGEGRRLHGHKKKIQGAFRAD